MGFENSDFRIEVMNLSSEYDVKHVRDFLTPLGFDYSPDQVEYTIMLYNLNGKILGSGSFLNGVLKFVAVAPKYRETSAFASIVTHLNDKVLSSGYKTVFVYTKPESSVKFQGLGFTEIATAPPLYSFLDFGYTTMVNYKNYLASRRIHPETENVAAVVVNCNPFTNGHLYLIEKAARENEILYIFVVEEERSAFPFKVRYKLIEDGTAHLNNVVLIRGSNYIVSGATFPSYFLKHESIDVITRNQTELDITVFAKQIAPTLNIKKRYVGTEDYCHTTAAYNDAMKKLLPRFGIQLHEVPRKTVDCKDTSCIISASNVRAAIQNDNLDAVKPFIPPTTYAFLKSPEAAEIIEKIKKAKSRH